MLISIDRTLLDISPDDDHEEMLANLITAKKLL